MKLYEHQQQVIDEDKKWFGNFRGTGSGKTLTTLHLAEGETLIIVPKQQFKDKMWEIKNKEYGTNVNLKVISKETFRRDWQKLPKVDTVIIDEAHNHFGVLPDTRYENREPVPKTSQLYDATVKYLARNPPKRLYLLTATPMIKPMHLWAIARIYGQKWDHAAFRQKFYFQVSLGGHRKMWKERNLPALKERLVELLKHFGYVGGLTDFFDVPPQTHLTHYVELTSDQNKAIQLLSETEADPMAIRTRRRTIENGILYGKDIIDCGIVDKFVDTVDHFKNEKIPYIIERAYEFKKLIVFANYTAQIEDITEALTKEGFGVLVLTGATKDRERIIEIAEKLDECVIVIQSSISAGYELKSFRTTIYASYSARVLDKIQADGRNLRADNLQKNLYITLVTRGGVDEQCYKAIQSGVDFNELATSGL